MTLVQKDLIACEAVTNLLGKIFTYSILENKQIGTKRALLKSKLNLLNNLIPKFNERFIVIKGLSLKNRETNDIDLLARISEKRPVDDFLRAGFTASFLQRIFFNKFYAITLRGNGFSVDLHRLIRIHEQEIINYKELEDTAEYSQDLNAFIPNKKNRDLIESIVFLYDLLNGKLDHKRVLYLSREIEFLDNRLVEIAVLISKKLISLGSCGNPVFIIPLKTQIKLRGLILSLLGLSWNWWIKTLPLYLIMAPERLKSLKV